LPRLVRLLFFLPPTLGIATLSSDGILPNLFGLLEFTPLNLAFDRLSKHM
jgi:hypothetical protein